MRGFHYCWFFLLVAFSSVSSVSIASTITVYWVQGYTGQHPTTQAACVATRPTAVAHAVTAELACYFKQYETSVSWTFAGTVMSGTVNCPYGDNGTTCNASCDAPKTMVDGQCVTPTTDPCTSKQGQDKSFIKTGVAGDGFGTMAGPYFSHGSSGCFDGCAVSIPIGTTNCKAKVSGEYACKGSGTYTGQQCTSGPLDFDDVPPETPLPPTEYQQQEPCIYTTGPDGTQSCTSNNVKGKQGQYCGTVNGETVCVNSPPSENGTQIDTQVQTKDNGDGTSSIIKTDTSTTTTCTGYNSCSSSTTVVTTTTTKDNATGDTTSVTGSCDGPQCPDDNTNPDGNGDGFGDCVGECGEGEGGAGDWYEPGEDTYASVIGEFADQVQNLPVTQGVTNFLTFTPSGACPVYEVDAWVFNIRLDQWCTGTTIPWDLIQAIILGCCAFLAFRIAFL